MYTIINSDQVNDYKHGRGPMATYLRNRDHAALLATIKDGTPLVQQETADALIAYFAPYMSSQDDIIGVLLAAIWQEAGKYFSLQRRNHILSEGSVVTYVATKPPGSYINAAVSYGGNLEPSKLQGNIATVEIATVAGTQSLVCMDMTRPTAPVCKVTIYDLLEQAIYPGGPYNVDMSQFPTKFRTLMIACGWDPVAYDGNSWTTGDAMARFSTALDAQINAATVPAWYMAADAVNAFSSSMGPVYREGNIAGGGTDWFYFSPNFNAEGPQFFFGRKGHPDIYVAFMPVLTLRTNFKNGLYDFMLQSTNYLASSASRAVFEPQSMGLFSAELLEARTEFFLNNNNYFNTTP